MSKKPDGRKAKKNGENKTDVAKAVKKPTVVKPHGPKPDFTPRESRLGYTGKVEQLYQHSCTQLGKLADGVQDTYGIKTDEGIVILDTRFHRGQNAIFVVESTVENIVPDHEYFVPVSCMRHDELRQVTPDNIFKWQVKLHNFLRPILAPFYGVKKKVEEVKDSSTPKNLTEADKEAIAAAEERRDRKGQNKFAKKRDEQKRAIALFNMRRHCVPAMKIATGNIGYCDLSSETGDLIANFYYVGNDKHVKVEYLSDNHVLQLAGIKVGDWIFASCIPRGEVDQIDRTRMSSDDFRKRSILAEHLREQLEIRNVRFIAKKAA